MPNATITQFNGIHARLLRGVWIGLFALSLGGWSLADSNLPLGVNVTSQGVDVRVWAPEARSVALIGDLNGWRPRARDVMTRDDRTGIWSTRLSSRPRGAYRFLINDTLERRDPYGRAVSADERSSVFHFPPESRGPGDRHIHIDLDDLVLYEMHIGTFNDPTPNDGQPATFTDAIRRLDHLVELGINAVCLLPLHEFNGKHSWGYNPSDLFAVEQTYGGPDGFRAFVQACHQRGIAVHLDIVHNHYGPENLDLLHFDGGNRRYFYEGDGGIAITPWGPRVKYSDPMVRRFIRDNVMFWVEEYGVDGFRWDSTINIRAWDNGAHAIPEGAAMLDEINRELRERHPKVLSIAEDSLDIGEFHASWQYDFHHTVMPFFTARSDAERDVGLLADALVPRSRMPRVIYTDNHDEAGLLNGQTRIVSDIDPANPASDTARRLSGLASVITLTAPGIPLLFMGNEFMESGTFHDDRPLDWTKARRHAGHVRLHRDLIALRRNLGKASMALRGNGLEILDVNRDQNVIVYARWHEQHPRDIITIAMNGSSQTLTNQTIPLPASGTWRILLNTDHSDYGGTSRPSTLRPITVTGATPTLPLTLPPYSAIILHLAQTAPESGAAPRPAPDRPRESLFSMFTSIHLIAVNERGETNRTLLTLVDDNQWDYHGPAEWTAGTRLHLAADNLPVTWGTTSGLMPAGSLVRGGQTFVLPDAWHGYAHISFDEREMTFSMRPSAPPPPEEPIDFRTWTSARGQTMTAKLHAVHQDRLTLKTPDGRKLFIAADQLSSPDQDYVRRVRDRFINDE